MTLGTSAGWVLGAGVDSKRAAVVGFIVGVTGTPDTHLTVNVV